MRAQGEIAHEHSVTQPTFRLLRASVGGCLMITGINHVTFSVADLARSLAFYRDVLGMQPVARWPRGAYLLAGDLWVALLVDEHARGEPRPEYSHVAFSIAQADFDSFATRVRTAGATIFKENQSEGDSLYFLDPDGHKLELHASDLGARLRHAREHPWEGLAILVGDDI